MALPVDKCKEIEHSEGRFIYTISTIEDHDGWFVGSIVIQCYTGYGGKLLVRNIPKLPHWKSFPKPIKDQIFNLVKPAYILRLISFGLESGWTPSNSGSGQDHYLDATKEAAKIDSSTNRR